MQRPVPAPVRQAARRYAEEGQTPEPVTVAGGRRVPYGHVRPVLHCRPLTVSAIRLQPGETVLSTSAGNQKDWAIQLAQSGPGGRTPVLMIKPRSTRPLRTNLIITTTRRIYEVVLSSPGLTDGPSDAEATGASGSSVLQFYYPDELVRTWARAAFAERPKHSRVATTEPRLNLNPTIALDEMNLRYRWEREQGFPWAPKTVFDDGEHVYIVLPGRAASAPAAALFIEGLNGQNMMLNYAPRGNMIITGRLFEQARFIYSQRTADGEAVHYELTIQRKDR